MANDTDSVFDIAQLWNCEHAFDFKCPQQWSALTKTEARGVRFCDTCQEHVTLCKSPEEFVELGNAGKCVAIPDGMTPLRMNMMLVGRPSPQAIERRNRQIAKYANWWARIIELAPKFAPKAFATINSLIKSNKRFARTSNEDDAR